MNEKTSNLKSKIRHAKLQISDIYSKINLMKRDNVLDSSVFREYAEARNLTTRKLCNLRHNIMKSIAIINPDVVVNISSPQRTSNKDILQYIKIRTMDVDVLFYIAEFSEFTKLLKDIYGVLPYFASIKTVELKRDNVITPDNVSKLAIGKLPQIIMCRVQFQIKDIKIND